MLNIVIRAVIAVGVLTLRPSLAPASPAIGSDDSLAVIPDDAGGRCVRAYLELLNQPTPERQAEFERAFASRERRESRSATLESRLRVTQDLHERLGSVRVERVLVAGESLVSVWLGVDRGKPMAAEFSFSVAEPGKLDEIVIAPAQERAVSEPIAPEARAQVVERAAELLRKNYVFPEKGAEMATLVRKRLDEGAYDRIADEVSLARRLTADFRSITNDRHLRVRLDPAPAAESESSSPPPPPGGDNFGFKKVEMLDGRIGYIRFDGFAEGPEAEAVAAAAMAFVANARAVIFDMRRNGGGSPEMVRFVCSYLFDERTHLNDMFDRKGRKVGEYWTRDSVPGRKLGSGVPVYVLTSSYTFSGAEEFTYNLKCLKRATIVGETTGGGAHPVKRMRINDRFAIGVPHMRACNPITGTNWEGTGVEPDIKCAADEALERAIAAAAK